MHFNASLNLLLYIFFVTLPFLCQAQKQHELKTELISVINRDITLSYEYGLTEKISVELDLKYEFSPRSFITSSTYNNQFPDSSYNFKFQYFEFTIGSSYYFFQKEGIDRLYLGAFWINRILTKDDPNYKTLFNEYYEINNPSKTETWPGSRVGLKSGYKWIINNHLVIQPELQIDYNFRDRFDEGLGRMNWTAVMKIGYRF